MDLKETIKLIFDGEIEVFFGKRPTELVEEDYGVLFTISEKYDELTEEEQKSLMKNIGYILATAEKMGMIFRNDVYNAYQHYIYSDNDKE